MWIAGRINRPWKIIGMRNQLGADKGGKARVEEEGSRYLWYACEFPEVIALALMNRAELDEQPATRDGRGGRAAMWTSGGGLWNFKRAKASDARLGASRSGYRRAASRALEIEVQSEGVPEGLAWSKP